MAQKTLTTRILMRSDTRENWVQNNPILLKGEIGLELNTKRYKIGNGIDTWDLLQYYAHLDSDDENSLAILISMLNDDDFGKVDGVLVNNKSVVTNKVANITIGMLTFTASEQEMNPNGESFTNNIILHKVAKTGDYNDLVNKISVIDNLESTSTNSALSANQGNVLFNLIENIETAKVYDKISDMVVALNDETKSSDYRLGMNLFVKQMNVPDFWISSIADTYSHYEYVDDNTLINAISQYGAIQIGYCYISLLETQKVDLSNYYTKTQIDSIIDGLDTSISEISQRLSDIEDDETILRTTDTFILNGGSSGV